MVAAHEINPSRQGFPQTSLLAVAPLVDSRPWSEPGPCCRRGVVSLARSIKAFLCLHAKLPVPPPRVPPSLQVAREASRRWAEPPPTAGQGFVSRRQQRGWPTGDLQMAGATLLPSAYVGAQAEEGRAGSATYGRGSLGKLPGLSCFLICETRPEYWSGCP